MLEDSCLHCRVSHLHLQLPNVVGGPGLVVVVVVRDSGETSCSVLRRDAIAACCAGATVQVLHRTSRTDPGLRDADGNRRRLEALALQNLHVDDVRSLRSSRTTINMQLKLDSRAFPVLWCHLVLGVQHHGLGVRDPAHVVLVLSRGQPHSGRQLVVEQRQL